MTAKELVQHISPSALCEALSEMVDNVDIASYDLDDPSAYENNDAFSAFYIVAQELVHNTGVSFWWKQAIQESYDKKTAFEVGYFLEKLEVKR